ncbi:MAG: hypothetical protein KJ767_03750 [Nanoarchaeota archaeon]|nr:hypothetical protein [Nanoarchaeota archaeon]
MDVKAEGLETLIREFEGPNHEVNGYALALFRSYGPVLELVGERTYWNSRYGAESHIINVPSRLEVLNNKGEWQQHPVIFDHHNHLTIFLAGRGYYSIYNGISNDKKLYEQAKEKGLTQGSIFNLKLIPKRD